MGNNIDDGWELLQRSTPINKSGIVEDFPKVVSDTEPLCFIITKNQSNSWADDLYQYGRLDNLRRIYH